MTSTSTSSKEGTVAPALRQLHQKILDFEAKYIRRLTSLDNNKKKPEKNLCMTAPLPRRPAPMPLAVGTPETSAGIPFGMNPNGENVRIRWNQEWPNQHSRQSAEVALENERRLAEIKKKSGVLKIGGKEYAANIKDFDYLGSLGQGTCGTVVKMRFKPTGDIVAVKQMVCNGNREEIKRILMDLDVVLRSHDCPFIVHCFGCLISESDVWICMELMATCLGKLLKTVKTPIPERILGKMTVSIVKALKYLKEKQGIIHRDIKPSNILLGWDGIVKLCDFGISGVLDNSKAKSRSAGVAAYMAPERITSDTYDIRADVWSLGISLVELSTKRSPYEGSQGDFHVLARIIDERPPSLSTSMGFSEMFCDFVNACLTKDYKQRPKYAKLLEHPFLQYYESVDVDVAAWFAEAVKED